MSSGITLGLALEAIRHYAVRCEQVMFGDKGAAGSTCPASRPESGQLGASSTGRVGMSYDPPPLAEPPSYSMHHRDFPKRNGPDLGLILSVAALIAMAGFIVALVVGIVTAGGG